MTSRERVLMALAHKEPDRIPLDVGVGKACKFSRDFYKKLLDYLGIQEEIDICYKVNQHVYASDAVLKELGVDIRAARVYTVPDTSSPEKDWEDEKNYYYMDEWGTGYRMAKEGGLYYDMTEFPLLDAEEEEDERYRWPTPPKIKPSCRNKTKDFQDRGYPVIECELFGNGFLQTGPRIYGFTSWLAMMAGEPERVEAFMDQLCKRKLQWWDQVFEVFGDTVDVVCESDDLGTQTGQFISQGMFENVLLPYYKKVFAHIKKKSRAKIFMHCCGSMKPFIPGFIDAGMDILNPVQITANGMDPYELKREFGKDITFWGGGIDTQNILPHGTREEIREAVKRSIDAFAKDGGFIFTPVHAIQADVPVENFMAMIEAFRDNSKY